MKKLFLLFLVISNIATAQIKRNADLFMKKDSIWYQSLNYKTGALPQSQITNLITNLAAKSDTSVGRWQKYTVTYSQLSTAATTNNILLFTLPIKARIEESYIKVNTAFSGGGLISYTLSIGTAGSNLKYSGAGAMSVFTGFVASTVSWQYLYVPESYSATTAINVYATSAVGNLSLATAGSADVYIKYSIVP